MPAFAEPGVWAGMWALQSGRHVAVAHVGGRQNVYVDFVAVQYVSTRERVRASAHVILAE